ncbi:ankyrin repeat domain-containing protein [Chryseobacterium arthrosphaerae]
MMKLYLICILLMFSCSGNSKKAEKETLIHENSLFSSKAGNLSGYNLKYNELGLAVKSNNLKRVQQLLQNGADIEIAGEDDFNAYGALYVAVVAGNGEMIKLIIKNKANVNPIINDEGYTLMIAAIQSGKISTVRTLIHSGTKINAVNDIEGNKKFVPLLEAIINEQSDIFKLLIDSGADPFEKNFENISAFDYAKEHNVSFLSLFNDRKHDNKEDTVIVEGIYKNDCKSETGLIILDAENAYLDLMTHDGYVRLVMAIKNNDIFFNSQAAITRLNKTLDWKSISLEKPVLRIETVSEDKISVHWTGFYNSRIKTVEIPENPFIIEGKKDRIIEKCK